MSLIFNGIYLYIKYGRLTSRHGCDVASVELDEDIMTAEDANKIISFFSAGSTMRY